MASTTVRLLEGYQTHIHTRQHTYHADEPLDSGGTDTAVTPTEMLLGALGSCIAITVKMYAERKGWHLDEVVVTLDIERFSGKDYPDYDGDAQFVYEIREQLKFVGVEIDDSKREKLLEIATKCPVSRVIELPTFFKRETIS